jgi:molecular chaperone GrpE
MTEKKHKAKHTPNENGETARDEAVPALSADEAEALKSQFAESQAKAQEYLDALQRERADFTNFRRRMEQEKSQLWQAASDDTFKKVLPVLDDLERALANRPTDEPWANGVELIYRKFQSVLEKEGLARIEAEGQPFDPNLHEAIMQEPSDLHESGTVTAVLQQGYLRGERVLRHALVKVAQ